MWALGVVVAAPSSDFLACVPRGFPSVGPECVKGIELNPYAAELARVSVWIGEIQWMRRNGFEAAKNPILRSLGTIENRDAVLNPDGTRAEWPQCDVVVGNPPFLGGKLMRASMGDAYVDTLFAAYRGAVQAEADLVLYWFANAGAMIADGLLSRAGLVATNSIRGGANRDTFRKALGDGRIFEAWDDEEWTVEGAAVRVSLVCFAGTFDGEAHLDGVPVAEIFTDLTARGLEGTNVDLTQAAKLRTNRGVAFQGPVKVGPFDVDGEGTARKWLSLPSNPNGEPNSNVLFPLLNGSDITRRDSGRWIVNFGEKSEVEAALFEAPFEYVRSEVRPLRASNRDRQRRENWWRLGRSGSDLKDATARLSQANSHQELLSTACLFGPLKEWFRIPLS